MEEFFLTILTIILGGLFLIEIVAIYFWPVLIPIFILSLIRKNKSNAKFKNNVIHSDANKQPKVYSDVSNERLESFDITDINLLKDFLYEKFVTFERAYNNLDYNTMYNNSTPKLYNNYHTNIILNLKFAQKKIIDDINRKNVIIFDTLSTTRKQVISTIIDIEYICFTQDSNGKIISGSPAPVNERFEVIFVKNYGDKSNNKCPNCGATITTDKCEYCGTAINLNKEFKIDSIKKIIQ